MAEIKIAEIDGEVNIPQCGDYPDFDVLEDMIKMHLGNDNDNDDKI
jgi:hypothetical protein